MLGIGRSWSVARAFSARQNVSMVQAKDVMARVRHTFLNKSELYCARTSKASAILRDVRPEWRALREREREVGVGYVGRDIRDVEKRIVQVRVWFGLANGLLCLGVTCVCRHRGYREENVSMGPSCLVFLSPRVKV